MYDNNLLMDIVSFVTKVVKGEKEDVDVKIYNQCMTANPDIIPKIKNTSPTMHSKRFVRPFDHVDNFCWIGTYNIYNHPDIGILRIQDITKSDYYNTLPKDASFSDFIKHFYTIGTFHLFDFIDENFNKINFCRLILFGDNPDSIEKIKFIIYQIRGVLFNIFSTMIKSDTVITSLLANFFAFKIFKEVFSTIDGTDIKEVMLSKEFTDGFIRSIYDEESQNKYNRFIDGVCNPSVPKLITYECFIEILMRDGVSY